MIGGIEFTDVAITGGVLTFTAITGVVEAPTLTTVVNSFTVTSTISCVIE
jgi:hypothetical protein